MPDFQGKVYLATSGQWSWKIYRDNEEICGGAGYATSDEADEECSENLRNYDHHEIPKDPNRFAQLLARVTDVKAVSVLQAICSGCRHTRDIEDQVEGDVRPSLLQLCELGLVHDDLVGGWKPTWFGHGVHNWAQQVWWSKNDPDLPLTEPRENENGQDIIDGCDDFREKLCTPGCCWCGKPQEAHPSEAIKAAEKFLGNTKAGPESRAGELPG